MQPVPEPAFQNIPHLVGGDVIRTSLWLPFSTDMPPTAGAWPSWADMPAYNFHQRLNDREK